jgi:transcriptional regulator GlxA family with amidase domain
MTIQILLYDGFDELDAIAPFEVLRAAAARREGWQVELVTLDGAPEVTAAHGLRISTGGRRLLAESRPDVLVVPGGGWADRAPRGAWVEAERGALPAALRQLQQAGTILASVCTGAMLLAAAGLLHGRPAVTHHTALDDLETRGAILVRARVVDDGEIVTAGGVTSGLDLALWLIERFAGAAAAHTAETRLEYERRGVVWRRSSSEETKP